MTYRNAVVVLLADALSFGLTLLEGMLILKLGTHRGFGGFGDVKCVCSGKLFVGSRGSRVQKEIRCGLWGWLGFM